MAKIYAVMNRKGGTGKTTTAIALAQGLARRRYEEGYTGDTAVLLVDLDPQGHVAGSLDLDTGGRCLSQFFLDRSNYGRVLMRAANESHARRGMWVVPATDNLTEAKRALIVNGKIDDALEWALGETRKLFEYIVLDCPPTLDFLQTAVYRFADLAVVPVRADYLSLNGAMQHTRDIVAAQQAGSKIAIKALVPTFFDTRINQCSAVVSRLIEVYGRDKVTVPIPSTIRVAEAPEYGMTVFEYAESRSSDNMAQIAAMAYNRVVERVMI
jgi:chromosome partitioning protein